MRTKSSYPTGWRVQHSQRGHLRRGLDRVAREDQQALQQEANRADRGRVRVQHSRRPCRKPSRLHRRSGSSIHQDRHREPSVRKFCLIFLQYLLTMLI